MNTQELIAFKQNALLWASKFEVCCCLDSNAYSDPYSKYDFLLAAGAKQLLNIPVGNAFSSLKKFHTLHPGWLFGILSYDLKNEIEDLRSSNQDELAFPDLCFFVPEYLIAVKNGQAEVLIGDSELIEIINNTPCEQVKNYCIPVIKPKMSKAVYLAKVEEIKKSIIMGDVYEVTFCQEFFTENIIINPYEAYKRLNRLSPTPFSGFLKIKDKYIISASPERFLCKRGHTLYSQPIKGTASRFSNKNEDLISKSTLANNTKEKTENVMIVDLVRNDLTKSAVKGSVEVKELFGVYTFPQVHQMISTICCTMKPELNPIDAIKNSFPAGSMTGAPKLSAMQLIEEKETCKRGSYSGGLGYFDPSGDFDFNVVIRTILYNSTQKYLSFQVGGAITYASSAEAEYEECLLKASAIVKTLKGPAS